jgi:hypothetical protein
MNILDYEKLDERQLSRLNARLINTFRNQDTSQDPIKPLQNKRSKQTYIRTMQKLFCYFSRVTDQLYLQQKTMFRPRLEEMSAWESVKELAEEVIQQKQADDANEANEDNNDEKSDELF